LTKNDYANQGKITGAIIPTAVAAVIDPVMIARRHSSQQINNPKLKQTPLPTLKHIDILAVKTHKSRRVRQNNT
jgi:hypothetical protein